MISTQAFKVTKGAPHVVLHLCHDVERIEQAVDFKVLNLYTLSFMYLNYLKHTLNAALHSNIKFESSGSSRRLC
jgi:hypothetical protein